MGSNADEANLLKSRLYLGLFVNRVVFEGVGGVGGMFIFLVSLLI